MKLHTRITAMKKTYWESGVYSKWIKVNGGIQRICPKDEVSVWLCCLVNWQLICFKQISLLLFLFLGWSSGAAVYCVHSQGTDQTVSVMWRVWESAVFPGDHIKCSGIQHKQDSLLFDLLFPLTITVHWLCFSQNVPPDLAICCFILEQSLSVRALQEMLSNSSVDEVLHNQP